MPKQPIDHCATGYQIGDIVRVQVSTTKPYEGVVVGFGRPSSARDCVRVGTPGTKTTRTLHKNFLTPVTLISPAQPTK